MLRLRSIVVALVLLVACHAPPVRHAEPAARPIRRVALRFRINDVTLPSPVVDARVDGRRTVALLDTGAESHVLSEWFARTVPLKLSSSKQTTYDAGGRTIEADLVEQASITIEGLKELDHRPVLSIDFLPELTKALNVGIVLSPQLIAGPDEATVLDFLHNELWVGPKAQILATLAKGGVRPASINARRCVDASAPAGYLQFVVPVDVDGEKAELLLDTGATSTSLKFSWARGRPIEARAHAAAEKASGASGPHETQVADGVSLAVAGIRRKLQAHLIPGSQDPRCREDGLLGMDMLRSCVLVFSSEDALAHCE